MASKIVHQSAPFQIIDLKEDVDNWYQVVTRGNAVNLELHVEVSADTASLDDEHAIAAFRSAIAAARMGMIGAMA